MTDLHYKISGKGSPIILIHGGGTDSRVWGRISERLSQDYMVITYDLRGHGQSPAPTETTNHVSDLKILFESLKIGQATLIGHSLGGQIAADFAILHAEKVNQLVLLSPGMTGYNYDEAYQEMVKSIWKAVPNVDSMLTIMLETPEAYSMQISMKSPYSQTIEQIHRDNILKSLHWKNFDQKWPITNTADRLSNLHVPVFFIIGSKDKKDLFRIKELYKTVPNIVFEEIAGVDHGLVFTAPDIIIDRILRFSNKKLVKKTRS